MDLRRIRPHHLADPDVWRRAFYATRDRRRNNLERHLTEDVPLLYFPRPEAHPFPRTLRILFVAPRYDYGDPRRGLGVEENYFFHTLLMMGHQLIRFDPLALMKSHGRANANRMLLEVAFRHQPDVLFAITFRDELDHRTVREISEGSRTVTVNWFCDDQWRFDNYSRHWAPNFNWVVTTSADALARYHQAGIKNVVHSQWACNHFLYRPLGISKQYDVSFVGQPHGERPAIIAALRRAGIRVAVWGFGWPAGRVTQTEMIRIFNASKINLNLSKASRGDADQIKGRDFEVPGCGSFLLTGRSRELARFYEPGREVGCYESVPDLIDKIRHYLLEVEERESIATAGYERTLRDHTMEARLNEIFRQILSPTFDERMNGTAAGAPRTAA